MRGGFILAKSWTAKSFFNHNQAPGQVCGRLPQGSLKGEMSGSERVKCQDLHGWAEMRRAVLGRAKLALCFQIPSQASWHGIVKSHRPFCYAKWPCDASSEIFRKKHRVALGFQAGMCFEKASASPLVSVFSTTNPAFAQRINPVIFGFPIRVYLGNRWFKNALFAARMSS